MGEAFLLAVGRAAGMEPTGNLGCVAPDRSTLRPPMATPRRIFGIYHYLGAHAEEIREFMQAVGTKSSTVDHLIAKDRVKLLSRFSEELIELCDVLDGTHKDPYIMEASQTWYWASLYAVACGAGWDDIGWKEAPLLAVQSGIASVADLRTTAERLPGLGPDQVRPTKLFVLWACADRLYRQITLADKVWTVEQIMEADLSEMRKRPYLAPVLRAVVD